MTTKSYEERVATKIHFGRGMYLKVFGMHIANDYVDTFLHHTRYASNIPKDVFERIFEVVNESSSWKIQPLLTYAATKDVLKYVYLAEEWSQDFKCGVKHGD